MVPNAAEEAQKFLQAHPETLARFDQVSELVSGFESPYGLELLATTHWVIKHEAAATQEAVERQIYSWNKRKRQFTPRQIKLARDIVAKI